MFCVIRIRDISSATVEVQGFLYRIYLSRQDQQNTVQLRPIPNRCKKKNIMLIKNLFSLFGGSYQTGRSDDASPNVIEEKESKVIIPEKFKDDIERLTKYGVELRSGLCIEIELSELLEILPRERRRKDAYDFIM